MTKRKNSKLRISSKRKNKSDSLSMKRVINWSLFQKKTRKQIGGAIKGMQKWEADGCTIESLRTRGIYLWEKWKNTSLNDDYKWEWVPLSISAKKRNTMFVSGFNVYDRNYVDYQFFIRRSLDAQAIILYSKKQDNTTYQYQVISTVDEQTQLKQLEDILGINISSNAEKLHEQLQIASGILVSAPESQSQQSVLISRQSLPKPQENLHISKRFLNVLPGNKEIETSPESIRSLLDQKLLDMIRGNREKGVFDALKQGATPTAVHLQTAIQERNPSIIRLLIEKKPQLAQGVLDQETGNTALHYAANAPPSFLIFSLKDEIGVNDKIHKVIRSMRIKDDNFTYKVAKLLTDKNADFKTRNKFDLIKYENTNWIWKLSPIGIEEKCNQTPLDIAKERNNTGVIRAIFEDAESKNESDVITGIFEHVKRKLGQLRDLEDLDSVAKYMELDSVAKYIDLVRAIFENDKDDLYSPHKKDILDIVTQKLTTLEVHFLIDKYIDLVRSISENDKISEQNSEKIKILHEIAQQKKNELPNRVNVKEEEKEAIKKLFNVTEEKKTSAPPTKSPIKILEELKQKIIIGDDNGVKEILKKGDNFCPNGKIGETIEDYQMCLVYTLKTKNLFKKENSSSREENGSLVNKLCISNDIITDPEGFVLKENTVQPVKLQAGYSIKCSIKGTLGVSTNVEFKIQEISDKGGYSTFYYPIEIVISTKGEELPKADTSQWVLHTSSRTIKFESLGIKNTDKEGESVILLNRENISPEMWNYLYYSSDLKNVSNPSETSYLNFITPEKINSSGEEATPKYSLLKRGPLSWDYYCGNLTIVSCDTFDFSKIDDKADWTYNGVKLSIRSLDLIETKYTFNTQNIKYLDYKDEINIETQEGNEIIKPTNFKLEESNSLIVKSKKLLTPGKKYQWTSLKMPKGKSPLQRACKNGRLSIVKHLITNGAKVQHLEKESFGKVILEGHFDVVEELLFSGYEIVDPGSLNRYLKYSAIPEIKGVFKVVNEKILKYFKWQKEKKNKKVLLLIKELQEVIETNKIKIQNFDLIVKLIKEWLKYKSHLETSGDVQKKYEMIYRKDIPEDFMNQNCVEYMEVQPSPSGGKKSRLKNKKNRNLTQKIKKFILY